MLGLMVLGKYPAQMLITVNISTIYANGNEEVDVLDLLI